MSIATTQKKSKNSRTSGLVCGTLLAVMVLATIALSFQALPPIIAMPIILTAAFGMVSAVIHFTIKDARESISIH